jgi:integrase
MPSGAVRPVPGPATGRGARGEAVLAAAEGSPLHAYIVMSLLTGARTEELRALHWHEVDRNGRPDASPPIPPSVAVYRSIRAGSDTKTVTSRRRLAMPQRCVDALRRHRDARRTHHHQTRWCSPRPTAPRSTPTTCAGRSAA